MVNGFFYLQIELFHKHHFRIKIGSQAQHKYCSLKNKIAMERVK